MDRNSVRTTAQLIRTNNAHTVGALMRLYESQRTGDALLRFTPRDGPLCLSMAQRYREDGTLTKRQLRCLQQVLGKYARILTLEGYKPRTCGAPRKLPAPMREAGLLGDRIYARFAGLGQVFNQLLERIKDISGRRWVEKQKHWLLPRTLEAVEVLRELEFNLGPKLLRWERHFRSTARTTQLDIPGLGGVLFPFQLQGVSFLQAREGRVLLADEMGLGKTIQVLAWLQLRQDVTRCVVVCPASLKWNWEREARKWLQPGTVVQVLSGKPARGDTVPKARLLIINYDVLRDWLPQLLGFGAQMLVLDEAHYVKNPKAKRTKTCRQLAKRADHVLCLTGTPVVNRPIELYNAIHMIKPGLLSSRWVFGHEYCGARKKRVKFRKNGKVCYATVWDYNGASSTAKLHKKLTGTLMLRRLKRDVLTQLPPKVRTVVPVHIDMERYREEEMELREWLQDNAEERGAAALTRIEQLKQLAVLLKLPMCLQWVEDWLDSGEKLVVFCTHHMTVDALMERFGARAVQVDGRVGLPQRQVAVDRFQQEPAVELFVGNIKAAGVGLTLTAAAATCFLELGWAPGDHDQAEDRIHRIGQEADSVSAYYLIATGTIEEQIADLLDAKHRVVSQVLDGKDVESESILTNLLRKYGRTKED